MADEVRRAPSGGPKSPSAHPERAGRGGYGGWAVDAERGGLDPRATVSPLLANIYMHYVFDLGPSNGERGTHAVTLSSCATVMTHCRIPASFRCRTVPEEPQRPSTFSVSRYSCGRTRSNPEKFPLLPVRSPMGPPRLQGHGTREARQDDRREGCIVSRTRSIDFTRVDVRLRP
jgi:hypothetical protein